MRPKQNPFYLDVPYDDLNDRIGAAERARVVPWAHLAPYRHKLANPNLSLMKNHWVKIIDHGRVCYGQIEDAGPGQYHDAAYVFGRARPRNRLYNGAGMDVSPALNGCLGFKELNGDTDVVSWRFIGFKDVPSGPWRRLVEPARSASPFSSRGRSWPKESPRCSPPRRVSTSSGRPRISTRPNAWSPKHRCRSWCSEPRTSDRNRSGC
jgi:hypothetical protein